MGFKSFTVPFPTDTSLDSRCPHNLKFKMRVFFCLLSLGLLVGLASAQTNYCSVCKNNDHTMCKYTGRAAKCSAAGPALTAAQKSELVNKHNELRQRVASGQETKSKTGQPQPAATNMKTMVWNDEIAAIAQRWADQCTFQHDTCRNTASSYVGQNIYQSGSSAAGCSPQLTAAVQNWYDEVKDFDPKNIDPFVSAAGPVTGHYTQVAWAESYQLGCGYSCYYDGKWYWTMVVCNYGPGGNVQGAGTAMYKKKA